jgi:hypothetical protein
MQHLGSHDAISFERSKALRQAERIWVMDRGIPIEEVLSNGL